MVRHGGRLLPGKGATFSASVNRPRRQMPGIFIFPIDCHSDAGYLGKCLLWQRAANFLCVRSSLWESVITTEFQATEPCSSLHLAKTKYGISGLSKGAKENAIVLISPSSFMACGKRK
jgi:hypothetical protein